MPIPPGAGAVEMAAMVFSMREPPFFHNFTGKYAKKGPPQGRPKAAYFFSIRP